nr:sesquiterpene synthase [Phanerodontia chrysosporium]
MLVDLAGQLQARLRALVGVEYFKDFVAVNDERAGTEETCRNALRCFVGRVKIPARVMQPDPTGSVTQSLRATVKAWGCIDTTSAACQKRVAAAVAITTLVFRHTRLDTQAYIAGYAFLAISLDDEAIGADALAAFAPRMLSGEPQGHWVLDRFIEHVQSAPTFFGAFSVAAIAACTVQFVNSTLLDRTTSNRVCLTAGSLPYVLYKRAINGVGDSFALFAWEKDRFPDDSLFLQVLPDLCRFMEYTNDILSFYKEELAGEKDNFVHDIMTVSELPAPGVLEGLVDAAAETVQRARLVLQDSEERKVFESMLEGYVAFHYTSPRYRLGDLSGASPADSD